jgi:hypothetical protein
MQATFRPVQPLRGIGTCTLGCLRLYRQQTIAQEGGSAPELNKALQALATLARLRELRKSSKEEVHLQERSPLRDPFWRQVLTTVSDVKLSDHVSGWPDKV